jgi:(2Fe-2S) ferredoxin
MSATRSVLICQGKTCRKAGAVKVLEVFELNAPEAVEVLASGCLGQCGNGPMVIITPEKVWYHRVSPEEVSAVVERHLKGGTPIQAMMYPDPH